METPYTNHLTREDYKFIYEPSEDTFFLLDALEADLLYIKELQPTICVEIGSGSGVIITALSKVLKSSYCIATDINSKACLASKKTALRNSALLDVLQMDLASCIRLSEIDLLIFNPPYVLTEREENDVSSTDNFVNQQIKYSWDGGRNGRETIDRLLKDLKNIISPKGVVYLLVLKENDPDYIVRSMEVLGFTAIKFMQRRIPGEHLYVIKIVNKIN